MTDATAPARAGRRGRGARRDARTAYTQRYLPEMERGIPYMDALLPEQVDIVHDRTMRLLESTGIEFRDDESIEMWRQAGSGGGVSIDGYRLRIDREFLMELVALAPSEYTMVGRDPARSVTLGGRKSIFTPAYGAPFVRDLDGNRRNATLDDFHNFAKIAQMTPAMQMAGGVLCEPMDIAVPHRHLHMTYSLMKHSTKPFMGAVTSRERAEDSLTMAQMLFGEEFVDQNTVMTCLANGNSPLVWDSTMLDAVKVYSGANQAMLFSPFVLGGGVDTSVDDRLGRADQRRGARRCCVQPDRSARCASGLWPVARHRVDEVGRPDGRHPRHRPYESAGRPTRPPLPAAVALLGHVHGIEGLRCPGRVRGRPQHVRRGACRRELCALDHGVHGVGAVSELRQGGGRR